MYYEKIVGLLSLCYDVYGGNKITIIFIKQLN